jgi:uncharacterized protein
VDLNLFVTCLVAGFIAQLIAGTLGMGYGTSLSIFLLSAGIPPAIASASIHASEVFTSAAAGMSYLRMGHVDRPLFIRLCLSGVVGGVTGAYILTNIPASTIKPFIALYLLVMGAVIIFKAFRQPELKEVRSHLIPLGLIGGFLDAVGGGGWGPVVTSTLLARGNSAHKTIGSVMLSGFFLSLAIAVTLFAHIDIRTQISTILGLIVGGLSATPIGIYLNGRLPHRALMGLIGALIIILSLHTIILVLTA